MKKLNFTLVLFFVVHHFSFGQINLHINKTEETTTYAISEIDSVYIDFSSLQKIIVLKDETQEGHLLSEIIEMTFTQPSFPPSFQNCGTVGTAVVDVFSPATGRTWMDRNLGALRVAQSETDVLAYGDLYQWGRRADGHQCRDSEITASLSGSSQPNHGDFIIANNVPFDWRNPQLDFLWQGINGVNNPCPEGYRIPTLNEIQAERASWETFDAPGAFESPLKLTRAGGRDRINGPIIGVGSRGYYWTSSVEQGTVKRSRRLRIDFSSALLSASARAMGASVRCIKN